MITGKKIAYVKVSTAEQNEARQLDALKPYEAEKIFLEKASTIASRICELFKSSRIDKKRRILNLVFPNFFLNGSKLEYTIRSPFNMLVNRASHFIKLGLVYKFRTSLLDNVA